MESPPSTSTWSEPFILSDDSGLLLTSGSSGSMSTCSRFANLQDSDCDEKLSQTDSLDGMSDIMCGENFNTLKKGPHWLDKISPPLEFQDKPTMVYEALAERLLPDIIDEGIRIYCESKKVPRQLFFLPFGSPPSSRRSLVTSRLSSSHNSLSVPSARKVDDSTFITQAVSHDTLVQISDIYNVPLDSDMYAVPADVIKPKRKQHKKKRRNTSSCCHELERIKQARQSSIRKCYVRCEPDKRHSVAGSSEREGEPIHMTLQEVRRYLQTLYSSSSESSVHREKESVVIATDVIPHNKIICAPPKFKKSTFLINLKNKKIKEPVKEPIIKASKPKKSTARMSSLKQALCNIFRFRRFISSDKKTEDVEYGENIVMVDKEARKPITNRALPPLPHKDEEKQEQGLDFATSIQKVKDYGWYWGPISSEAAEKILSNEPDGSFIVRDSSDDHYIFSLTFKLNNSVRHVRIEHDQGNFSFGSCTKFKSQTIVEFIENAVEHSRSGRYLFFLHRRPVIGPVRVQLLHPVSRFKQVQSLQHMCRFIILKLVRRDLLPALPLPRRMTDYLNTPHYYSEHLSEVTEEDESAVTSVPAPNPELSPFSNNTRQS